MTKLGIRALVWSFHRTTSGLDWKESPVNMRKQLYHTKYEKIEDESLLVVG